MGRYIPYFNFSVTYQNHGPYDENYYEENQFIKNKDGYDKVTFNMFNNYLAGINRTDQAIEMLIEYFRNHSLYLKYQDDRRKRLY